MWGMHSIRETSGVLDTLYYLRLFEVKIFLYFVILIKYYY